MASRKKSRLRRLLVFVGIPLTLLLIAYFARRPVFESFIVDKLQTGLSDLLVADVKIGAIKGSWLTNIVLEDVVIVGAESSAYQEIRDVDIKLGFSPLAALAGTFGDVVNGLDTLSITGKRVVLDLNKSFSAPRDEKKNEKWQMSPFDLLRMFEGGASLKIDELVLSPDYVRPAAAVITIEPGTGTRRVSIVTGGSRITGEIDPRGEYRVEVHGDEGGRLLRTAIETDTVDHGVFDVTLKGNTETGRLTAGLDLESELRNGSRVGARLLVELEDGRLQAPSLHVDFPGVTIDGKSIDVPVSDLSAQAVDAVLHRQDDGLLTIQITDLTSYEALLPAQVKSLLPITGELAVSISQGIVTLRPSLLRGKGVELQLDKGSISLLDQPVTGFTKRQFERAFAKGIAVDLKVTQPLVIDLPGSSKLTLLGGIKGEVSGSVARPDAKMDVDLRDVAYEEYRAGSLVGKVAFDGSRIAVDALQLRDAEFGPDSKVVSVDGTATFVLSGDGRPDSRLTFALRGPWPGGAIPGSRPSDDVLAEIGPVETRGDIRFGPDGTIHADEFAANTKAFDVSARGRIKPADLTLDAVASAEVRELSSIMRLLGQPAVTGKASITKLHISGSFAEPEFEVAGTADVATFAPEWFPEDARHQLPEAPITVAIDLASKPSAIDVAKLQLQWGKPGKRRVELNGKGPLPVKLANPDKTSAPKIVAAQSEAPFVVDFSGTLDAAAPAPKPPADEPKPVPESDPLTRPPPTPIEFHGQALIDARQIRVPAFEAKSPDGALRGRELRAGADLTQILAGTLTWLDVPIQGTVELEEFRFGGLFASFLQQPVVHGRARGKLAIAGKTSRPELAGSITIEDGSIAYPSAPVLSELATTAEFADRQVLVTAKANLAGKPIELSGKVDSGDQPIWQALFRRDLPVRGAIKLLGLDLSAVTKLSAELPDLVGHATIEGTFAGTIAQLEPDLEIRVDDAGWQVPGSPPVSALEVRARILRQSIELNRCAARVREVPLTFTGSASVKDAAIWDIFANPDLQFEANAKFVDIPLEVLPKQRLGLADIAGLVGGDFSFVGSRSAPQPKLNVSLENAAVKFASIPRIDQLKARLQVEPSRATLSGNATVGAGPVEITADVTPGAGTFLESYAAAKIDAKIKGKNVLLVRTGGLKVRGDVDLTAIGELAKINVGGEISINSSKYVKRLSLVPDLKVSGGAGAGDAFGPWQIEGGHRFLFDVHVKTSEPIHVATNVLDTELDLDCRLQGQGNDLHLTGVFSSRRGKIRFPGMAMDITSLRLMFNKANPTRPTVLASATGQRHGITINMRARGPWDDPTIDLSSTPSLSAKDLWALVTTGLRPSSLGKNSAASNAGILATFVLQELVLSYFRSESTESAESFVSRFTFDFGEEISTNGEETWAVNFDVGGLWIVPKSVGLRFERDVYEDYNLGLVYRWRF